MFTNANNHANVVSFLKGKGIDNRLAESIADKWLETEHKAYLNGLALGLTRKLKTKKHLCDITNKQMEYLVKISGETAGDVAVKILRTKDLDDNVIAITAKCECTYSDGSKSNKEIVVMPEGLIYMRHSGNKCDNICRRDVCCNQVEMIDWLRLQGFVFPIQREVSLELPF